MFEHLDPLRCRLGTAGHPVWPPRVTTVAKLTGCKTYVLLYNTNMPTTSYTEVREGLAGMLDELEAKGGEFTITRHGKPVAVMVAHDEYESLIETLNILADDDTMAALAEAESDVANGNIGEA